MASARVLSLISGDNNETNTLTYFGGISLPETPQMDTPNINFLNDLISGASFFDISTYLREKYFNVIWGYLFLREPPQNETPQNQFFERLNLRCQCFSYQYIFKRQII